MSLIKFTIVRSKHPFRCCYMYKFLIITVVVAMDDVAVATRFC